MGKQRGPRLHDLKTVKRELGCLYREARLGKIDTQDASRLANLLSILARIIQGTDLEARLTALEESNGKFQ